MIVTNPLAGRVNSDACTMLYTGKKFFYARVTKDDIDILDIAHHLARQCRWLGAMDVEHYSVAEHSWLMADFALHNFGPNTVLKAFGFLMHDSEEYVIGDFPSPLKAIIPELSVYGDYLRSMIFDKYDIPWDIYTDLAKPFDIAIRATEAEYVQNAKALFRNVQPLNVLPHFWRPCIAEHKFLEMFSYLTDELKRERMHVV